jgi:ribosomal protein S18 acetylase RimI-like enzyme
MEKQAIEIVELSNDEVDGVRNQILSIYREAFSTPPYSRGEIDVHSFSGSFARHRERKGFRCVVARDGRSAQIIGFTYGYTSAPGQWWHDLVEGVMDSATAREWLSDTFELVELAVSPPSQGQGAGGRLHDTLLAGLPHRAAVLSTMQAETVALKLYRKRGWITLLEDFYFPGTPKPYQIMGLMMRRDPVS